MSRYKKVHVMAVVSFDNVRKGDSGTVELTPRIQGIINSGYLKEVEDVSLPDRPSTDQSSDSGSGSTGTDDGGPAGSEPSEDLDAG
jgi:hypothetical protein